MNKFLCNRLNQEQALEKLKGETFERKTLSFYRYVKMQDPQAMRDQLFRIWQALDCLGRIYIAEEGINAQMNVPQPHWDKFVEALQSFDEFKHMKFKHALESPTESFWKLAIIVKEKIVADGIDDPSFDVSKVGTHVDAKQFNQLLDQDAVCVDMRNFYESEVGHFKGAVLPPAETFRDELPMAKELLRGKENQDVVLYCTGGIRCEKASAYLRQHGFKRVYQLHGGIIQYKHEVESGGLENKFIGKNFVFDDRLGERVSDDIIAKCHTCQATCDNHVNCLNKACNLLFIQCESCSKKLSGCCEENCQHIYKLPEEAQKQAWKIFKKKNPLSLGRA